MEGHLPDPHLHSHCFVFNATFDPIEGRIKAGQFGDIQRDIPYYKAQFHKTLADKLTDLGYQVRQTDKAFEIEGVPQRVIHLLSKRTDEIGRVAEEKGITDPKELNELGARTRAKKQKGASMDELRQAWRSQILALGPDGIGENAVVRFAPVKDAIPETARETVTVSPGTARAPVLPDKAPAVNAPLQITAQQCVDYALLHCFERASVMDGRRILERALYRAVGVRGASAREITKRFEEDKRIIHVEEKGRTLCTTKEVLAEERRMVDLARAGQGKMIPLYKTAPDISLPDERQRRAVAHILTTPHRVSIIRGVAGAGKTTLMPEAVAHVERVGRTVMTVAASSGASGVLRKKGFKEATTVAYLLENTARQNALKNQVLWVDEAGLLGTKDMKALLELTTRQNARLILSGDTRQHASVQRGDALRILNTVGGIQAAEVTQIYRQTQSQYRDAVKDLSEGNVARAFEKLDGMGCIKDVDESSIVKDYVEVLKRGKSALVISPTHAQGEKVTEEIRAELRNQGFLGKKEIEVTRLRNLHLTEAEKSDPRAFKPGQVVQFTQNASGFKRGSQWEVSQRTPTDVRITDGGDTRPLPTDKSDRYEVFAKETIPLSKGDKIRITKNGFDADKGRLNNGDLLKVVSVSRRDGIVLQNEISKATHRIDKSFLHLAHGHSITSQGAQAKGVDDVFLFQPAATFPATDAKQFYVSVSRGRHMVHIYTDDKKELLRHARNMRERQSALELVGEERQRDANMRRQQEQIRNQPQRTRGRDDGPER